jgi:hypothetical protein
VIKKSGYVHIEHQDPTNTLYYCCIKHFGYFLEADEGAVDVRGNILIKVTALAEKEDLKFTQWTEGHGFMISLKMVSLIDLCPYGYIRYISKHINEQNYSISKKFCAKLIIHYNIMARVESQKSKFILTIAFPVKLESIDTEVISKRCKAHYTSNPGSSPLVYDIININNSNTYYCKEKEKWYINNKTNIAIRFLDDFGSFTREGEKGYIMDYVNPKYHELGTKIVDDNNDSSSYLMGIIASHIKPQCPFNCKMHLCKCFCRSTLSIDDNVGISLMKICKLFGTVKNVFIKNGDHQCEMRSIRQTFLNNGIFNLRVKLIETKLEGVKVQGFEFINGPFGRKYFITWPKGYNK